MPGDQIKALLQAVTEADSPYAVGYASAAVPPDFQPSCPYPRDSKEADEWWDGYGQWADDIEFLNTLD